MRKSNFISHRHFLLKPIVYLWLITFSVSSFVYPEYLFAADSREGASEAHDPHSPVADPANLKLPSGIGRFDEIYLAPGSKDLPAVFLIQDAHAVPDAQKSLVKIIDYLEAEAGLDLVGLEGTQGEIDTLLLRAFPERKAVEKVFTEYLNRGELSGAYAAAVLNANPSDYHGVETWGIYQKAIDSFLEALILKDGILENIRTLEADLEILKNKYYSKEFYEFDREAGAILNTSEGLAEFIPKLEARAAKAGLLAGLDLYPNLAAIAEEIKKEDASQLTPQEIDGWAEIIRNHVKGKSQIAEFNARQQDFQTEKISSGDFIHHLYQLAKANGVLLPGQERVEETIRFQQTLKAMTGAAFFKELNTLIAEIKTRIILTDEEKSLDQLSRKVNLLNGVANLKLSYDEWLEFSADEKNSFSAMSDDIAELSEKVRAQTDELQLPENAYVKFYTLALQRDQAMAENLLRLMREKKTKRAAIVAGGFHAEGLKNILKEKNISFALITPVITKIPEDDRYLDFMQGRVSWADYFKAEDGRINLYEAFTKATVNKLLAWSVERGADSAANLNDNNYTLKSWRDTVIKELNVQKRINDAGLYTRFIDSAAVEALNPENIEKLRQAWLARVDRFIEGLRLLKNESKLTPENILQLANAATAVSPFSIPGHTLVPAAWLRPDRTPAKSESLIALDDRSAAEPLDNAQDKRSETRAQEYPFENFENELYSALYDFHPDDIAAYIDAVASNNYRRIEIEPGLNQIDRLIGEIAAETGEEPGREDLLAILEELFSEINTRKTEITRRNFLIGFGVAAAGLLAGGNYLALRTFKAKDESSFDLSEYKIKIARYADNPAMKDFVERHRLKVFNANFFYDQYGEKKASGLVRDESDREPVNANGKGKMEAEAIFLVSQTGEAKIIDTPEHTGGSSSSAVNAYIDAFNAQYPLEEWPNAFQAGPMAIRTVDGVTEINPRLFDSKGTKGWYDGWYHGRLVVVGLDGDGNFHTKDIRGLDITGKTGPTKRELKRLLEEWKSKYSIQNAMFTDGGTTGILKDPPYAIVLVPNSRISEFRNAANVSRSESREVINDRDGSVIPQPGDEVYESRQDKLFADILQGLTPLQAQRMVATFDFPKIFSKINNGDLKKLPLINLSPDFMRDLREDLFSKKDLDSSLKVSNLDSRIAAESAKLSKNPRIARKINEMFFKGMAGFKSDIVLSALRDVARINSKDGGLVNPEAVRMFREKLGEEFIPPALDIAANRYRFNLQDQITIHGFPESRKPIRIRLEAVIRDRDGKRIPTAGILAIRMPEEVMLKSEMAWSELADLMDQNENYLDEIAAERLQESEGAYAIRRIDMSVDDRTVLFDTESGRTIWFQADQAYGSPADPTKSTFALHFEEPSASRLNIQDETSYRPGNKRSESRISQSQTPLLDRNERFYDQIVHDIFILLLKKQISGFDVRENALSARTRNELDPDIENVIKQVEKKRKAPLSMLDTRSVLTEVSEKIIGEFEEKLLKTLIDNEVSAAQIQNFLVRGEEADFDITADKSYEQITEIFLSVQDVLLESEAPPHQFKAYLQRVMRKLAEEEYFETKYAEVSEDEAFESELPARELPFRSLKAFLFASGLSAALALGITGYYQLKDTRILPSLFDRAARDVRGPPSEEITVGQIREEAGKRDLFRMSEKEFTLAYNANINLSAPIDLRVEEIDFITEAVLQSFYPDASEEEIDKARMYWLRVAFNESDKLRTKLQYSVGGPGTGLWQIETARYKKNGTLIGSATAETMLRAVLNPESRLYQYKDLAIRIFGGEENLKYFAVNGDPAVAKKGENKKNSEELREYIVTHDAAGLFLALLKLETKNKSIADIPDDLAGHAEFWAENHWAGAVKKRPAKIENFTIKANQLDEILKQSPYHQTISALRGQSSPAIELGAVLGERIITLAALSSGAEVPDSDVEVRSEARSEEAKIKQALSKKGINPAEVTTFIYYASGGDTAFMAEIKKVFPNINQVHYIAPSYRDYEEERQTKAEILEAMGAAENEVRVFVYPEDYQSVDLALPEEGRRVWLDKLPGDMGSLRHYPYFYLSALEKEHIRPNRDLVMTAEVQDIPYAPYAWQKRLGEGFLLPGYWDKSYTYSFSMPTEKDIEILKEAHAKKQDRFKSYSMAVLDKDRKKQVTSTQDFYEAIREWAEKYDLYQIIVTQQTKEGKELPRDIFRFAPNQTDWQKWLKQYENAFAFPAELELYIPDNSDHIKLMIRNVHPSNDGQGKRSESREEKHDNRSGITEPNLHYPTKMGEAYKALLFDPHVSETSIRIRSLLTQIGPELQQAIRNALKDPDISISLTPFGELLLGTADTNYVPFGVHVVILDSNDTLGKIFTTSLEFQQMVNRKAKELLLEFTEGEEDADSWAFETDYFRDILIGALLQGKYDMVDNMVKNLFHAGLHEDVVKQLTFLFLPQIYGDPLMIEVGRANALYYMTRYGQEALWEGIREKYLNRHLILRWGTFFANLRGESWLEKQGLRDINEESFKQFRLRKAQEIGLPSFEEILDEYNERSESRAVATTAEVLKNIQEVLAALDISSASKLLLYGPYAEDKQAAETVLNLTLINDGQKAARFPTKEFPLALSRRMKVPELEVILSDFKYAEEIKNWEIGADPDYLGSRYLWVIDKDGYFGLFKNESGEVKYISLEDYNKSRSDRVSDKPESPLGRDDLRSEVRWADPQLEKMNAYSKTLRLSVNDPHTTQETIRNRKLLRKAGPEIEAVVRRYLGDGEAKIAIFPIRNHLIGNAYAGVPFEFVIDVIGTKITQEKADNLDPALYETLEADILEILSKYLGEQGLYLPLLTFHPFGILPPQGLIAVDFHEKVRRSIEKGDRITFNLLMKKLSVTFLPLLYGDGEVIEELRREVVASVAELQAAISSRPGFPDVNIWNSIRNSFNENYISLNWESFENDSELTNWLIDQLGPEERGPFVDDLLIRQGILQEEQRIEGAHESVETFFQRYKSSKLHKIGLPASDVMRTIYPYRSEARDDEVAGAFSDFKQDVDTSLPSAATQQHLTSEPVFSEKGSRAVEIIRGAAKESPAAVKKIISVTPAQKTTDFKEVPVYASEKPEERHRHMTAFEYQRGPEGNILTVLNHSSFGRREAGVIRLKWSDWGIVTDENHYYLFHDALTGRAYLRQGEELLKNGLYVSPENGAHVFWIEDINDQTIHKQEWPKMLGQLWASLASREVNPLLFRNVDAANGLYGIYSEMNGAGYPSAASQLRYIRLDFTKDGHISIQTAERKRQLETSPGDFVILQGEPGARAALVLTSLFNRGSADSIRQLQPFEKETAQFLKQLTAVMNQIESILGGFENTQIKRLRITDGQQNIIASAVSGKDQKGQPRRFLLTINPTLSRTNQKEYASVELPEDWVFKEGRTAHELTDWAPSIFNLSPNQMQYTQSGRHLRIGLIPYYFSPEMPSDLWMHFFEINSRQVPAVEAYINRDKTVRAALDEGQFTPQPGRATVYEMGQKIKVKGRVYLNDSAGQPLWISADEAARLIQAEAEHNFGYASTEAVPAVIVPEESGAGSYVFEAELPAPAVPGMFWVNMRFRVVEDMSRQTVYSVPDHRRAVVVANIPESYRQIPDKENRMAIASAEIDKKNLNSEDPVSRELIEKAKIAYGFALQDPAATGEIFAASSLLKGKNRAYLYSWIRDGVQNALGHLNAESPELREIGEKYFDFVWEGYQNTGRFTDQRWRHVGGKVVRPVTSFNDPQTDGPAHVGRLALEYLRKGLRKDDAGQRKKAITLISNAVDEILAAARNSYLLLTLGGYAGGKDPRGFDIWEELYGLHFSNFLISYSFLEEIRIELESGSNLLPRQLLSKLETPVAGGLLPLQALEDILMHQFASTASQGRFPSHFVAHRKVQNAEKMDREKNLERLDTQMLWAFLYADRKPFNEDHAVVLGTYNELRKLFDGWGPFGREVKRTFPRVVTMGRYEGDLYDGNFYHEEPFTGPGEIGMSGAHYWFISTLWAAIFDLRFAGREIADGKFEVNSPAYVEYLRELLKTDGHDFESLGIKVGREISPEEPLFNLIAYAVFDRATEVLRFVSGYISENESLYEQFNKYNGAPQGTADLNWSNETFVQAVIERDAYSKLLASKNISTTRSESRDGNAENRDREFARLVLDLDLSWPADRRIIQELSGILGKIKDNELNRIRPVDLSKEFFEGTLRPFRQSKDNALVIDTLWELLEEERFKLPGENIYNQVLLLGMLTLRDDLFTAFLKEIVRLSSDGSLVNAAAVRLFREAADSSSAQASRDGYSTFAKDRLENRFRMHPKERLAVLGFTRAKTPIDIYFRFVEGADPSDKATIQVTAPADILFAEGRVWKGIESKILTSGGYQKDRIKRYVLKQKQAASQKERVSPEGTPLVTRTLRLKAGSEIVLFDTSTQQTIRFKIETVTFNQNQPSLSVVLLRKPEQLPIGVTLRGPDKSKPQTSRSEARIPEPDEEVPEIETKEISFASVTDSGQPASSDRAPAIQARSENREAMLTRVFELDQDTIRPRFDEKHRQLLRDIVRAYSDFDIEIPLTADPADGVIDTAEKLIQFLRKHMVTVRGPLYEKSEDIKRRYEEVNAKHYAKSKKEAAQLEKRLQAELQKLQQDATNLSWDEVEKISFDLLSAHLILDIYYNLKGGAESEKKRILNNSQARQLLSYNKDLFSRADEPHASVLTLTRILALAESFERLNMKSIQRLAFETILRDEDAPPDIKAIAASSYLIYLGGHFIPQLKGEAEKIAAVSQFGFNAVHDLQQEHAHLRQDSLRELANNLYYATIRYAQYVRDEDALKTLGETVADIMAAHPNDPAQGIVLYEVLILLSGLIQNENPEEADALLKRAKELSDEVILWQTNVREQDRPVYRQATELEIRLLKTDRDSLDPDERKREITDINEKAQGLLKNFDRIDDDLLKLLTLVLLVVANYKLEEEADMLKYTVEFFSVLGRLSRDEGYFSTRREFLAGVSDPYMLVIAGVAGDLLANYRLWPESPEALNEIMRFVWQQDSSAAVNIWAEAVFALDQAGEDPAPYQDRIISLFRSLADYDAEHARTIGFEIVSKFRKKTPAVSNAIYEAMKEHARLEAVKSEEFLSDFLFARDFDRGRGPEETRQIFFDYAESVLLASDFDAGKVFQIIDLIDQRIRETWFLTAYTEVSFMSDVAQVIESYFKRLEQMDPEGLAKLKASLGAHLKDLFDHYHIPHEGRAPRDEGIGFYYLLLAGLYEKAGLQDEANVIMVEMAEKMKTFYFNENERRLEFKAQRETFDFEESYIARGLNALSVYLTETAFQASRTDADLYASERELAPYFRMWTLLFRFSARLVTEENPGRDKIFRERHLRWLLKSFANMRWALRFEAIQGNQKILAEMKRIVGDMIDYAIQHELHENSVERIRLLAMLAFFTGDEARFRILSQGWVSSPHFDHADLSPLLQAGQALREYETLLPVIFAASKGNYKNSREVLGKAIEKMEARIPVIEDYIQSPESEDGIAVTYYILRAHFETLLGNGEAALEFIGKAKIRDAEETAGFSSALNEALILDLNGRESAAIAAMRKAVSGVIKSEEGLQGDSAKYARATTMEFAAWTAMIIPKEHKAVMRRVIFQALTEETNSNAVRVYFQLLRFFDGFSNAELLIKHITELSRDPSKVLPVRDYAILDEAIQWTDGADQKLALLNALEQWLKAADKNSASKIKKSKSILEMRIDSEDWLHIAEEYISRGKYREAQDAAAKGLDQGRIKAVAKNERAAVQTKLERVRVTIAEIIERHKAMRTVYENNQYEEAGDLARAFLGDYPEDSYADRIQRNSAILIKARNLILQGKAKEASELLEGVPEDLEDEEKNHKDKQIRNAIKHVNSFIEGGSEAVRMLDENRYLAAETTANNAIKTIMRLWPFSERQTQADDSSAEGIRDALEDVENLRQLYIQIEAIKSQIKDALEDLNPERRDVSLKRAFTSAKALAKYPEHRDEVYDKILRRAYGIFNEASRETNLRSRERKYLAAFHLARIIYELSPEFPLVSERVLRPKKLKGTVKEQPASEIVREVDYTYIRAARLLISQAVGNVLLPDFLDDSYIVRAMAESEKLRYARERKGLELSEGELPHWNFGTVRMRPGSFVVRSFGDKAVMNYIRRGDTFTLSYKQTGQDRKEISSSFRVKDVGRDWEGDYVELELPVNHEKYLSIRQDVEHLAGLRYALRTMTLMLDNTWASQDKAVSPLVESLYATVIGPYQNNRLPHLNRGSELDFEKMKAAIRNNQPMPYPEATLGKGNALDHFVGLAIRQPEVTIEPQKEKQPLIEERRRILAHIEDIEDNILGFKLDPEQKEALLSIAGSEDLSVLTQGPAGTGKTLTIILAAYLYYLRYKKQVRILTQPNDATDNIIERMLQEPWARHFSETIIRLGNRDEQVAEKARLVHMEKENRLKSAAEKIMMAKEGPLGEESGSAILSTIASAYFDRHLRQYPSLLESTMLVLDEGSRATLFEALWAAVRFDGVQKYLSVLDLLQLSPYGITQSEVDDAMYEFDEAGISVLAKSKQKEFLEKPLEEIFHRKKQKNFSRSLFERLHAVYESAEDGFFEVTKQAFFVLRQQRRSYRWIVEGSNYHYKRRGVELVAARETEGKQGLYVIVDTDKWAPQSRIMKRTGRMGDSEERAVGLYNTREVFYTMDAIFQLMNDRIVDGENLASDQIAVIPPYNGMIEELSSALTDMTLVHTYLTEIENGKKPELNALAVVARPDSSEHSGAQNPPNYFRKWVDENNLRNRSFVLMGDDQDRIALDLRYDEVRTKFAELDFLLKNNQMKEAAIKAKELRELIGMGENFVSYEDFLHGKFNLLSIDASIGNEYDTVIIPWTRSNNEGNAGFLEKQRDEPADVYITEGERRRNVATSRARMVLWQIGSFSYTFARSRDEEFVKWSRHMVNVSKMAGHYMPARSNKKVQDILRRSEARGQSESARSETRVESGDPLKGAVLDVLTQMAKGGVQPSEKVIQFWRAYEEQPEEVEDAVRAEAEKLFDNVLAAGGIKVETDRLADFVSPRNLERFEALMRETLASRDGNLSFAWAMAFPENENVQNWIRGFLQKVEKVKRESGNADRIDANLAFFVTAEQKDAFYAFSETLTDSKKIRAVELSDKIAFQKQIADYFKEHSNALIYGLSNEFKGLLGRENERRQVQLERGFQDYEAAFPAFALMNFVTAQELKITAELLKQIPNIFGSDSSIVGYDGSHLVVFSAVRDLVLGSAIDRMFAIAA